MKGFSLWLLQRITAGYMLIVIPIALLVIILGMPWQFETWKILWADSRVQFVVVIFFWGLLLHAWVGLRDVVLDYLHPLWLKLSALTLIALFLLTHAIWILKILWHQ
jgi:succinate dehydrogenase / fumarate reductase membrane anchor subunit